VVLFELCLFFDKARRAVSQGFIFLSFSLCLLYVVDASFGTTLRLQVSFTQYPPSFVVPFGDVEHEAEPAG
jgi:hypothetical protein